MSFGLINFNSLCDWGEIGIQFGPKHVIYQKLENIM